ncbi:MAG: flavodoxin family protein [Caldiserica bacterium]|jgi:flavodoxin|nr:flavodoxin family protein [Caldisericota bacterium]MDH7562204.1 flavodoxin family protein [Caldisericota bacterium]
MKVLVVYDSLFGNTQKVASAISQAFGEEGIVSKITEIDPSKIGEFDLLIFGSPTHGGWPTPAFQKFLKEIPSESLKGKSFAAFDTRATAFIARVFGYAAKRIADILISKGGIPVFPPEGFLVKASKGPLKEGEIERALEWGKRIREVSAKIF